MLFCLRDCLALLIILGTLVPFVLSGSECEASECPLETFQRVNAWITKHGGSISSTVEVKGVGESFNGNGVVAKVDLPENFTFARIPLEVMINIEHALVSDVNSEGQLEDLNDLDALALFLCNEASKGDASKWSAFIDSWPTDPTQFPLFLSNVQLSVIAKEDPVLYKEMVKFRDTVEDRFYSLTDKSCSFEEFKLYISLVRSRIFSVKVFGYGRWHKTFALVPFADFLNTGLTTNCDCITNHASTHLECFLTTAVSRGEQLLAPYVYQDKGDHGNKGDINRHLWMHYGFTLFREDVNVSQDNRIHRLRLSLANQQQHDE